MQPRRRVTIHILLLEGSLLHWSGWNLFSELEYSRDSRTMNIASVLGKYGKNLYGKLEDLVTEGSYKRPIFSQKARSTSTVSFPKCMLVLRAQLWRSWASFLALFFAQPSNAIDNEFLFFLPPSHPLLIVSYYNPVMVFLAPALPQSTFSSGPYQHALHKHRSDPSTLWALQFSPAMQRLSLLSSEISLHWGVSERIDTQVNSSLTHP